MMESDQRMKFFLNRLEPRCHREHGERMVETLKSPPVSSVQFGAIQDWQNENQEPPVSNDDINHPPMVKIIPIPVVEAILSHLTI